MSKKSNSILGLIRQSFDYIDKEIFKTSFKSLVRPHLEYGNIIWASYYKRDITVIENVQRRGSKLVHELKGLQYEERIKCLGLSSLIYRGFRGDMVETYKHISEYYDAKPMMKIDTHRKTKGHEAKIFTERYNTNIGR